MPGSLALAQKPVAPQQVETLASALNAQSWNVVENSIDRALAWLASQQVGDGSFSAPDTAQPGTTSLAVMAFLSKGHLPGEGPYGARIERGIEYVLRSQQGTGLLSSTGTSAGVVGKTANYNHAISGLMLTEAYGLTSRAQAIKLKPAILKALDFTRRIQTMPKSYPQDAGGWRYLNSQSTSDSDLSVTSWQIMFMRSARNAEFDVPKQYIDDAIGYVLRCWDEREAVFYYKKTGNEYRWSRGMVGAGVLCMAMAGQHESRIARRAGDWLLLHPFRFFGESVGTGDRFFYSTYYCSQAMSQLGGQYWKSFFPTLANILVRSQQSSGEWPDEPTGNDRVYGNSYTTALAVLSLTPPLQLLPVYQR